MTTVQEGLTQTAQPGRPETLPPVGKHPVNVGELERFGSVLLGGMLVLRGLGRRSIAGLGIAALGGLMIRRGVTGYCAGYQKLGVTPEDRTFTSNPFTRALHVQRSVVINRSAADCYDFCRDLANLPRFMDRLESVQTNGDEKAHWIARGPAGMKFEWDSETTEHRPNEFLAWRSTGGDIENSGWVRFDTLPNDRGTLLTCGLRYRLPGGILTAALARLLGEDPQTQLEGDLRRFKQVMETESTKGH